MSAPRFFCAARLAPGAIVELSESASRHALRVLRMPAGAELKVFNGDGQDYLARLLPPHNKGARAQVALATSCDAVMESPLRITLAQAISSGDRMDFTLQKAVELGVNSIQPLATERSVVKLSGERAEKRREHWQNVVVAACEQCGRAIVPPVAAPLALTDWLNTTSEFGLKLMLSPVATRTLHDLPQPAGNICLLTGCEGGFTPIEVRAAENAGFALIRMGARVLRTETAPLAALAAIQALWGDF